MDDLDKRPRPETLSDPLGISGAQLLGRYQVGDRLASGGSSLLYKGMDERLRRAVCVKVFYAFRQEQSGYRIGYEHFVQEAFALSQLQHPNTLRIYDFGHLDTTTRAPFFVSELLEGGTLTQRVRREGRMSPAQVLEVLEPLVHALSEAHGRGIIHRDIKPSNILFGNAGSRRIVKLADFGIAKAHAAEQPLPFRATQTQANAGEALTMFSPGWAAPEQMRAEPVGPPTDVFALGLVLAYMLTGRKVFADDNVLETLASRMEGDVYLQSAVRLLGLSEPMQAVIGKACRASPAERYATVEELLEAVRRAVQSEASGEEGSAAGTTTSPVAGPLVTLEAPVEEIVVGGRRVRLVAIAGTLDLGGPAGPVQSPGRVRLTFLPAPWSSPRVHLKGLNCFLQPEGKRASSATDVGEDMLLELQGAGRERLDALRCQVGRLIGEKVRHFAMPEGTLAVPRGWAQRCVLLDFGPGRESILAYSI